MAELVIALDSPDKASALAMARQIADVAPWVKVGLELYTAEGPPVLTALKDMGLKVFLDLKFLDIPNTVRGAVRSAVRAGADMLNVHTTGGMRMMEAAREGLAEAASPGAPPLLLGVTVLTSMDERDLSLAPGRTVADLVLDLARSARRAGLHGVVCSGHEAALVKDACGAGFVCLTPGIRPAGSQDDQRRVMTPGQAVRAGADYLVVGRPVTQSAAPRDTVLSLLEQIRQSEIG